MCFGDCPPILRPFKLLREGEKPNAQLLIALAFRGFLFLAVVHALPFEAASRHWRASWCRCLCWCLHFTGKGQALAGGRDGAKGPRCPRGREEAGRAPAVLSFPRALLEQASLGKSF